MGFAPPGAGRDTYPPFGVVGRIHRVLGLNLATRFEGDQLLLEVPWGGVAEVSHGMPGDRV